MNKPEPTLDIQPRGGGAVWPLLIAMVIVVLVAVSLAIGVGTLSAVQPRVLCFVGDELVFAEYFDAATYNEAGLIDASLHGITNTVRPPEHGACYIAR